MLDAKLILSEDQNNILAVDIWEATNTIDLGANGDTHLGEEEHLRLRVEVSTTFVEAVAGALLTIRGMTDTDATLAGSTVWCTTPTIVVGSLKAGDLIMDIGLPTDHKRFIGVVYEVTVQAFSAGAVNAYVYVR